MKLCVDTLEGIMVDEKALNSDKISAAKAILPHLVPTLKSVEHRGGPKVMVYVGAVETARQVLAGEVEQPTSLPDHKPREFAAADRPPVPVKGLPYYLDDEESE